MMEKKAYQIPTSPTENFLPTLGMKDKKDPKGRVAAVTLVALGSFVACSTPPNQLQELKDLQPVDALIDCGVESGRKPEALILDKELKTIRINADAKHPAVIATNPETKGKPTSIQAVNPDRKLNIASNETADPKLATVLITFGDVFVPRYTETGNALISCPANVSNAVDQAVRDLINGGYPSVDHIWLGPKNKLDQSRTGLITKEELATRPTPMPAN